MSKGRKQILRYGLLISGVILLLAFAYIYYAHFYPQVDPNNRARVVQAIYAYRDDHGEFPKQLTDLIPSYISAIPKDRSGKPMFYSIDSVNGFNLSYRIRQNYGCGISDKEPEWGCGFGD